MGGVYAILNVRTGRRYIGSSRWIARRWSQHRSKLATGAHANAALQADWILHGADAFMWQVLEALTGSQDDRIEAEQRHIDTTENPYNAARRAGSGPRDGFRHTPESIARMKLVAVGRRNKSLETRAKIAAAHRGKTLTPEHRAAIGRGRLGKKHSEATKARLRVVLANAPRPSGASISAAKKGKPWSPARRAAHDLRKAG